MAWILSSAFVEVCESWLCSQEPGGVSSEAIYSDGEQSVQSKSSLTVSLYCAKDKMKGFSHLSRYGMTSEPLTESRGKELLTLYLEASRAKTSAQPTKKEMESKENALDSGRKCGESFAKYDRNLSMWKIPLCLLPKVSIPFLETWPRAGMMQSGECWEEVTLERRTNGNESGYLQEQFQTPVRHDASNRDAIAETTICRDNPALETFVMFFPTPLAHNAKAGISIPDMKKHELELEALVKIMPGTKDSPGEKLIQTGIDRMVKDGKNGLSRLKKLSPWKLLKFLRNCGYITPQEMKETASQTGGKLNPEFVEWLMGWPIGWTGLQPLETVKYQQSPH